jgi:hypothetical protein
MLAPGADLLPVLTQCSNIVTTDPARDLVYTVKLGGCDYKSV